jgi:hypothetical protein
MAIKDLISWNNKGREVGFQRGADIHPFFALHREMNRMFDDVFRGFDLAPFGPTRALDGLGWTPDRHRRDRQGGADHRPSCPGSMRRTSVWKSQTAFFQSRARKKRNRKTRLVASANGTTAASNGAYRCTTSMRTKPQPGSRMAY